jgi:hypothetical protein
MEVESLWIKLEQKKKKVEEETKQKDMTLTSVSIIHHEETKILKEYPDIYVTGI